MRIKHHYYVEHKNRLQKFLDDSDISYEFFVDINGSQHLVFDMYEDDCVYRKFKMKFPYITKDDWILKDIEYSKQDIENAEWLRVCHPGTKVQYEYANDAFKKSCSYKSFLFRDVCYRHLEQIGSLSASKPVKWGRQFFAGPNSMDDFIFCSERTKQILEGNWEGLEFWPVKKYNKEEYIHDLYQLYFAKKLPVEALEGGKKVFCRNCGREILRVSGIIQQYKIKKEYLTDKRCVYQSGDVITTDIFGYNTFSINIVSQEFYQFCEKNKMNRGMVYEPIVLI